MATAGINGLHAGELRTRLAQPGPRVPSERPSFAWSFRVGHVAGITVRVHVTFPLLMAWVVVASWRQGPWVAAEGLLLLSCTFGVVVLHELGHALVARRFGVRTRDITLLPIGGVATLDRMPERPREELLVALAGPGVNFALALLLFGVVLVLGVALPLDVFQAAGAPFLAKLMWLNVAMGAFNLLPAFPMDGGRVLRALLSARYGRVQATEVAARVGRVGALGLGLLGLFFAPTLMFIAVFVWLGGQQELLSVRLMEQLAGLTAADAMVRQLVVLDGADPLSRAVELSLTGFQHDFPVGSDGELVGLLPREALLEALQTQSLAAPVASVMSAQLVTVGPHTPLREVLDQLQAQGARSAAVVDGQQLLGLLTAEHVADRLASDAAIARHQSQPGPAPGGAPSVNQGFPQPQERESWKRKSLR